MNRTLLSAACQLPSYTENPEATLEGQCIFLLHWIGHHILPVRKRGSERTEAGESALPAEESPWRLRALSRERELLEFYKKTASISSRERENRITLLAVVLILDPHLSYHLTFPLLSVGAVGDEGDPVWLCYPTILPELVKERTE